MKILFNDVSKQWDDIKDEIMPKLNNLFERSDFIDGKAVAEFEENFASYIGTKHAIGVSNGTDALKISLAALNLESPCGIIIPANTFIATALAATYLPNFNYELILGWHNMAKTSIPVKHSIGIAGSPSLDNIFDNYDKLCYMKKVRGFII